MSVQQQQSQSDAQIQAQQQMAQASLDQQRHIAAAQAQQNQQQFDYQQQQDQQRLKDTQDQAARQTAWDQSRTQRGDAATQQVNNAFSKFTPDYFKQYQQDYYNQADAEINRQYGYAQKDLAFGLARTGNLASTTAADQQGQQLETKGRAEADQANAAVTAANQLKTQTSAAKSGLLGQALSSDTLGSPIAPGSSDSVNAAIDSSTRALANVGSGAKDYAAGINTVTPNLGTLAGLFGGAASGTANYLQGSQDAKLAAAWGGSGVSATGTGGGGSTRTY